MSDQPSLFTMTPEFGEGSFATQDSVAAYDNTREGRQSGSDPK